MTVEDIKPSPFQTWIDSKALSAYPINILPIF